MNKFLKNIAIGLTLVSALTGVTGCSSLMDDEPAACPSGLEVRFIYDYNLERANAFPAQVECLVLHIYDSEGNFVRTLEETTSVLADEDYRMRIDDLPEGEYSLVAYGGAICDEASITHTALPAAGSRIHELGMALDEACLEYESPAGHLHDHFYGAEHNVKVKIQPELNKVTVKMMKNTNHFRIMLQHLSYEPLDGRDYEFRIIDDNTLFDHTNDLVANSEVSYTAWTKGAVSTGTTGDESEAGSRAITEVSAAYADLSTSRLMTKNSPRLVVTHRDSGTEIINIPLNNYLLALRSEHFSWCGDQEFLDRKSDWPLVFFLDNPLHWNKAFIKINDWIVRINEINQ